MKRFMLCLALGAGVLSACSASQTTQTAAGLSGTYDVTSVGDYVFVTSADRNELRALYLTGSPRDWVRAPNPIEPLSIPVLDRPIYLARDIHYDAAGGEVTGPYVYARSTGTDELSVVAADPDYFKEVKRLKGLGFVTAFAGRGADNGGNSVLYYATQEESGAHLFRVELPGPDALLASGDTQYQGKEILLAAPLTDQTVTALLVMPTADANQEPIVVATRRTSLAAAQGNRTFKLDAHTGTELMEYQFGGAVRLLATNPKVSNLLLDEGACTQLDELDPPKLNQNSDHSLNAGTYVYGALDESVCTQQDQEACAGIVAVEADTGALAQDATLTPMLPIRVGQALPTGLSIAADAHILMRCNGASTVMRRPLIGIVPASDGRINIFDAAGLRSFDLDTPTDTDKTLGASGQSGNSILDINGNAKSVSRLNGDGTPNFAAYIHLDTKEGATRDDTYRVLYKGALPGLANRPIRSSEGADKTVDCTTTPGQCTFSVEDEAVKSGMVREQDIISLANDAGPCLKEDGLTPIYVTISKVTLSPSTNPVGQLTTQGLPTDSCPDPTRFTVRANGDYPLVVNSDTKGYLGRVMLNEDVTFTLPGGYFFHPNGFNSSDPTNPQRHDPAYDKASAYLHLEHMQDELASTLTWGDQLVVTAQSGVRPFAAGVDTSTTTGGLTTFRLPGPVVHVQVGDPTAPVDFAYIAYPSANGILQVSLAGLEDNVANLRGLVPFE
ncbi:MAG: hypothetical protein ACJ8AT_08395 [Hyalangium sp.]|uniref:hypothetical protein n=1 Tax=Hyalangium sp. TaxID=2028555 RepID=UPI00389A602F